MPWHWRRPSLEFIAPPVEQVTSDAQQLAELRSRHDAALRLIDELTAASPYGGADQLLDIRLVLAPPAEPVVVPGPSRFARTTANYWENP